MIAVMIIVALFVLGLVFGSFVNALVWRLHEQEKVEKRSKKRVQELSIARGRSMCPHCRHTLAARDLVPVFSWLWLRGRCRYCHKAISAQYPLVELATAALFSGLYLLWPNELAGSQRVLLGFWLVYAVFFMALALYDLKWFLLPNKLVVPLTVLAVLQVLVMSAIGPDRWELLWQPLVGGVLAYGIFWGLYQFSDGQWIGGGDVKLVFALGLIAGTPLHALLVIFFASLLGTAVSLPLLWQGKQGLKRHIPFGPHLLAGCLLVGLFAERIVEWYQRTLL